MYPVRKSNPMLKMVAMVMYDLPVPVNLTIMWNFGSLLGVCWVVQVLSGLLLACHYTADVSLAFDSVVYIMRDVNNGWLVRSIHANGASAFFICIYVHIARGIFYHSYCFKKTWLVGCNMFLLLMAIAFTGYVLPWGQMSYWGATVITNLVTAIPYLGQSLVEWIWGGYSVGNATLKRFFVFHFLMPFVLFILIGFHIMFLHETGSGNPLGVDSDAEAVPFHSFYTLKDVVGIFIMVSLLMFVCLCYPDLFSDPVNFSPADPMKTPAHIQPEWYFLFAYAILRSVPNKLAGVVAFLLSIAVLYVLPFVPQGVNRGIQFDPVSQVVFWLFVSNFILLSYIGACPIEYPYDWVGIVSSILYFSCYPLLVYAHVGWELFIDAALRYNYEEHGELDWDSEEEF